MNAPVSFPKVAQSKLPLLIFNLIHLNLILRFKRDWGIKLSKNCQEVVGKFLKSFQMIDGISNKDHSVKIKPKMLLRTFC